MAELSELLQPFKADEDPTRIICLVDDLEAMRVAVLWPYVGAAWRRPAGKVPKDPIDLWDWLWSGVEVDGERFAKMAELPEKRVESKMAMLAAARLVYPDGTIASQARGLIQRRVGREMFAGAKRRK